MRFISPKDVKRNTRSRCPKVIVDAVPFDGALLFWHTGANIASAVGNVRVTVTPVAGIKAARHASVSLPGASIHDTAPKN